MSVPQPPPPRVPPPPRRPGVSPPPTFPGHRHQRDHEKRQAAVKQRRQQVIGAALSQIQGALIARGVDPGTAIRYAQIALSRPGVEIGKKGIRYQGRTYDPAAFASSKLADYVTGLTAQNENQAAIQGDAGYQTDVANAQLQKELQTAGLDEQQRRAILDFGSPAYTTDPLLAGEAAANPFSLEAQLGRQKALQLAQVQQAASRQGTLFGGGAIAGQAQAQRNYAGAQTDATQRLVDLLANLAQQRASAGSIFQTTQQTALQNATQRLMQSGVIHAAQAPKLGIGRFRWWKPPVQADPVAGNGGGGGRRGGQPGRRPYPVGARPAPGVPL